MVMMKMGRTVRSSSFPVVAVVVATALLVCLWAAEEAHAQQFSHPSFMLLWRTDTSPASKRSMNTPPVVDLRHLLEPLLNPSAHAASSSQSSSSSASSSASASEEVQREKRVYTPETLFDYVDPTEDVLEQIRGVGPMGFIEIDSASTSFNRPLFDYDSLVRAAYIVKYHYPPPICFSATWSGFGGYIHNIRIYTYLHTMMLMPEGRY
jgi:hypothetical protein